MKAFKSSSPPDELDLLLQEALKHQLNGKRGSGAVIRVKHIENHLHNTYANPDNWRYIRTVRLVYIGETGSESDLGLFDEMQHKCPGTRKLTRSTRENVLSDMADVEYVRGTNWFRDYTPLVVDETPEERSAIRAYIERQKPLALSDVMDQATADHLLEELGIQ